LKTFSPLTVVGTTDASYDIQVRQERDTGKIYLERFDGQLLSAVNVDEHAVDKLKDAVLGEWKRRFIVNLQNTDVSSSVSIEVRGAAVDYKMIDGNAVISPRHDVLPATDLQLAKGDYMQFQVRITAVDGAYLSVLDCGPDGSVKPIFPQDHVPVANYQDNKIKADGQWHTLPIVFQLTDSGTETIKFIATKDPADFSALLWMPPEVNARGPLGKGAAQAIPDPLRALGQMLRDVQVGQNISDIVTKGAVTYVGSNWSTARVVVNVK
jgi:hypothetical protein